MVADFFVVEQFNSGYRWFDGLSLWLCSALSRSAAKSDFLGLSGTVSWPWSSH
jgi:hypothetical protein